MSWESTVVYYQLLNRMARALERGGVECLLICTNTMHKIAPQVQQAVDIPLLHIADATAAAVKTGEVMKPLLLATCYTMEQDFYTGRLRGTHGIDVRVPDDVGRATVHDIIYEELCQGIIEPGSKQAYEAVVARAQVRRVRRRCGLWLHGSGSSGAPGRLFPTVFRHDGDSRTGCHRLCTELSICFGRPAPGSSVCARRVV
jgi:aspartate racemase